MLQMYTLKANKLCNQDIKTKKKKNEQKNYQHHNACPVAVLKPFFQGLWSMNSLNLSNKTARGQTVVPRKPCLKWADNLSTDMWLCSRTVHSVRSLKSSALRKLHVPFCPCIKYRQTSVWTGQLHHVIF